MLVQPCDAGRRPTSPAIRIGPIRADADIAVIRAWLQAGDLDPALLPARLTRLHRSVAAAVVN